jgi:hypothetical protein
MQRRGPHKRGVHRWHGLAAILTMVTMRRAMHCVAALHRLFWRCRGLTVECISRECDREHCQKKWPN